MSSQNRTLVLAGAIVIASAGAFMAGRATAPSGADAGDQAGSGTALETKSSRSGPGLAELAADARRSKDGQAAAKETAKGAEALEKMQALMRLTDPIERSKAWLDFINTIEPAEFENVVASFRGLGITNSRMTEYSMLLSAWAKTDPTKALEYAQANTGNRFARTTILSAWAAYDPDAALRWAQSNFQADDENDGNPWMIGVIRGLAEHDPARASQLLATMPYSEERGEALGELLPHLLAQGGDSARAWAESIQDEALKEGAISRIAEALASKDPAGTADWLLKNPGQAADRSMDNVISAWMDQDQASAMAYYQALPKGDARTNALRGVANSMALKDPRAAADFLDSNAAYANDRVYEQFVWHSFGEAPDIAASYIAKLGNAGQQERLYDRMLGGWLRRDYNAASQWISQNNLPEGVATRIERRMEQRRR